MRKLSLLTATALLWLAAGCSKPATPPNTAADEDAKGKGAGAPATAQKEAVGKAVEDNQGGGLSISPEIMALCPGIKPPKFGFDSAVLRDDWQLALKTLAACMNSGGLVGKSVLLTGHTDPRGDDDYNMALGGKRAESVKTAIVTFGVEGGRLEVTSRGKVDAKGTDDESWSRDRRVDIGLLIGKASAH